MQITQFLLSLYDTLLVYYPNIFFVLLPLLVICSAYGLYRVVVFVFFITVEETRHHFTKTLTHGEKINNTHIRIYKAWVLFLRKVKKRANGILLAIEKEVFVDE